MLGANQLIKRFGSQFTLSISALSLQAEGITIIMGHNGSGKTVLLKLLAGLSLPDSGAILKPPTLNYPKITFVPQRPALLNNSVFENIAMPLRYQKHPHIKQRVEETLDWADITSLYQHNALSLSAGQQQLVAIARAWALTPDILLLDEPSANLDPYRQQLIESLIQNLQKSGCKIIMSTHNVSQAKRLATDIIFLHNGNLITHIDKQLFFTINTAESIHGFNESNLKKIKSFMSYH